MKKLNILALAAVLVGLAAPAAFADQIRFLALPKMKFIKGATSDSTTISNLGTGTSTVITSVTDTTEWLDLGNYKFVGHTSGTPSSGTASPYVLFQISQTVAADSVGYVVQHAADGSDLTKCTTGTQAYAVGSLGNIVVGIDGDDVAGRFVRLILWDNDASTSGVVKQHSVIPIIRGNP